MEHIQSNFSPDTKKFLEAPQEQYAFMDMIEEKFEKDKNSGLLKTHREKIIAMIEVYTLEGDTELFDHELALAENYRLINQLAYSHEEKITYNDISIKHESVLPILKGFFPLYRDFLQEQEIKFEQTKANYKVKKNKHDAIDVMKSMEDRIDEEEARNNSGEKKESVDTVELMQQLDSVKKTLTSGQILSYEAIKIIVSAFDNYQTMPDYIEVKQEREAYDSMKLLLANDDDSNFESEGISTQSRQALINFVYKYHNSLWNITNNVKYAGNNPRSVKEQMNEIKSQFNKSTDFEGGEESYEYSLN